MQIETTKSEIDLISRNLISELRNVDGTTKKVTYAKEHNVTMLDATEVMIGQEPIKKFWSIKVFFGKTGKKPFYYHFDKDEYFQLSQYVYMFKIKTNSLLERKHETKSNKGFCDVCKTEIDDYGCECGKY